MSISVSSFIRPSRLLRIALCGFALLQAGAALCLLATGGRLPAGALLLAAGLAAGRAGRGEMKRRIDISGPGTIGLTVQQRLGTGAAAGAISLPVRLLPGSTLWTHCLLLCLQPEEGGAEIRLVILPDCMTGKEYRALAVALRAIAGRDNKFVEKHKIL